jgi:hypothetical protein
LYVSNYLGYFYRDLALWLIKIDTSFVNNLVSRTFMGDSEGSIYFHQLDILQYLIENGAKFSSGAIEAAKKNLTSLEIPLSKEEFEIWEQILDFFSKTSPSPPKNDDIEIKPPEKFFSPFSSIEKHFFLDIVPLTPLRKITERQLKIQFSNLFRKYGEMIQDFISDGAGNPLDTESFFDKIILKLRSQVEGVYISATLEILFVVVQKFGPECEDILSSVWDVLGEILKHFFVVSKEAGDNLDIDAFFSTIFLHLKSNAEDKQAARILEILPLIVRVFGPKDKRIIEYSWKVLGEITKKFLDSEWTSTLAHELGYLLIQATNLYLEENPKEQGLQEYAELIVENTLLACIAQPEFPLGVKVSLWLVDKFEFGDEECFHNILFSLFESNYLGYFRDELAVWLSKMDESFVKKYIFFNVFSSYCEKAVYSYQKDVIRYLLANKKYGFETMEILRGRVEEKKDNLPESYTKVCIELLGYIYPALLKPFLEFDFSKTSEERRYQKYRINVNYISKIEWRAKNLLDSKDLPFESRQFLEDNLFSKVEKSKEEPPTRMKTSSEKRKSKKKTMISREELLRKPLSKKSHENNLDPIK